MTNWSGCSRPRDHGEGVVERRLAVVDVELHVDARSGPGPTWYWKPRPPWKSSGAAGAAERAQQRLGLAVGDRGRRGVREVLAPGRAAGAACRAPRAGPGVSGSPGYSQRYWIEPRWMRVGRAEGAVGVDRALDEAVVLRVGVDDHADRAVLLGEVRLDAAEVLAVADEHDLAVRRRRRACRAPRSPRAGRSWRRPPARSRRPRASRRCSRPRCSACPAATGSRCPRWWPAALRRRGHRHLDAARLGEVDAVVRAADLQAVRAQHGHRLLEAAAVAGGAVEAVEARQRAVGGAQRGRVDGLLEALLVGLLARGVGGACSRRAARSRSARRRRRRRTRARRRRARRACARAWLHGTLRGSMDRVAGDCAAGSRNTRPRPAANAARAARPRTSTRAGGPRQRASALVIVR